MKRFLLGMTFFASLPLFAKVEDWSMNNRWFLYGDFVYMRMEGGTNHTLVLDQKSKELTSGCCPDHEVLDVHDLDPGFKPGWRVGASVMTSKRTTYEASYMHINHWHRVETAHADRSLSFPFTHERYTRDFKRASQAKGIIKSHFRTAEANLWRHLTPRRENFFSGSVIFGLRYMVLDENFNIIFHRRLKKTKISEKSNYTIDVNNHLYGGQLGANLQWNPTRRWSFDFDAKVGMALDHVSEKSFLGDKDNQVTLRHIRMVRYKSPLFVDTAAMLTYQWATHYNLHVGYQCIYMNGVALATDQIDFHTGSDSGHHLEAIARVWVYGVSGGLSFCF